MEINIPIVDMNDENMDVLERIGVITRLMPGRHKLDVAMGESRHVSLYETDDSFGGHKIITVTINSNIPQNFVYHNDNEDFLLIDTADNASLILTICMLHKDELSRKIESNELSSEDFIALRCKFNDPFLSFFTMHKHFAHVETVEFSSDRPPSFYVTESRALDENRIDLKAYVLNIQAEKIEI